MTVRAKFICTSVEKAKGWKGGPDFLWTAKFQAVTGEGAPENKEFWAATPSGQVSLSSILQDAFEVGREYYLDISPCEAERTSA